MTHQIVDIDHASMQCYLQRAHRERSKATWELLGAISRGISKAKRLLTGTGTIRDGAACTH